MAGAEAEFEIIGLEILWQVLQILSSPRTPIFRLSCSMRTGKFSEFISQRQVVGAISAASAIGRASAKIRAGNEGSRWTPDSCSDLRRAISTLANRSTGHGEGGAAGVTSILPMACWAVLSNFCKRLRLKINKTPK